MTLASRRRFITAAEPVRRSAGPGILPWSLTRSGKSQPPRLHDPICFALRLRRLLGVGVRAEVIRTLLRSARRASDVADDRHYSIHHSEWAALLGLPSAPAIPLHYDWIPALRALTQVARWLQQPGLDELTPYVRSSQARTLAAAIDADLRYAGVSTITYAARGADFWDEFVQIVRATVRHASGPPAGERPRLTDQLAAGP